MMTSGEGGCGARFKQVAEHVVSSVPIKQEGDMNKLITNWFFCEVNTSKL